MAEPVLDRRIAFERATDTDNGRGGRTQVWTVHKRAWAEMIPLRGDEALRNAIEQNVQLWKVTIRWQAGITRQHRIRDQGRILDIETCERPTGSRDWLVITATEDRAP
ncbi:phage head closure protein [Sphingomonas sp. SFZ2018-12]|uniref:phage head closure protein n=1 Tax=Sphingomonas sp. SFZ2018-12 TaxID=2683197 RepID=UPI001F0EBFEB|nr:phage head closure protein [Sphingomonas sp. SFZ2018-12]MCH4894004.1 phage head closure protein [Sphingomonas sp. SFZ2018-12]